MGLFSKNTETGADELIRNLEQGKTAYEGYMTPVSDLGLSGYRQMGSLLGLGGQGSQEQAYDTFYNTPGIKFAQDEASRATTRHMAAQGFGGSGNILAALQERSMGLAGQQFNTYLGQLGQFTQPGLQARSYLADMTMNYFSQRGQAEAAKKAAKEAGKFDWGAALGGAISGFAVGGPAGAALGGLGGGISGGGAAGGGGFGSLLNGLGGGSLNYNKDVTAFGGGGNINNDAFMKSVFGDLY